MTIYEVSNIEYCTVEEIGDPIIFYRITANEGYYIHRDDGDEGSENVWKKVTMLRSDENPNILKIIAEADLTENTKIC